VGDEDDIDSTFFVCDDKAPDDIGYEKLRNLYANNARVGRPRVTSSNHRISLVVLRLPILTTTKPLKRHFLNEGAGFDRK
jgi:hypothetical protein